MSSLVTLFYETLLKQPAGTTSMTGIVFEPRFVFGRDSGGALVANRLDLNFSIDISLLGVYGVTVPTTFSKTIRPSDYLPRNELNALRALGIDVDVEMDPIDLQFAFTTGVQGGVSVAIGGNVGSPTFSTTLKADSGVFVGMATRAYMEEAVLSAGLTLSLRQTLLHEEATFAIDGDGAVQRNAVGKFVDTDFAISAT